MNEKINLIVNHLFKGELSEKKLKSKEEIICLMTYLEEREEDFIHTLDIILEYIKKGALMTVSGVLGILNEKHLNLVAQYIRIKYINELAKRWDE